MASEVMDLPQPDSPTRPMVSPGRTEKLTWSTTFTSPWRGNLMHKSLTSMTGGSVLLGSKRSVRFISASRSLARDSSRLSCWAA